MTSKVGCINQPYFFPYLGYFEMLAKCDSFVALNDVSMIKKGYIHRNRLGNGELKWDFTIPISKISQNKKINETFTSGWPEYSNKLFNKIKNSYNHFPYYSQVQEVWENINVINDQKISDLAVSSLRETCRLLDIKIDFFDSSDFDTSCLRGQDRILNLCQQLAFTDYWNLPGGKNLYQENAFLERGLSLHFVGDVKEQSQALINTFNGEKISVIDILARYHKNEITEALQNT